MAPVAVNNDGITLTIFDKQEFRICQRSRTMASRGDVKIQFFKRLEKKTLKKDFFMIQSVGIVKQGLCSVVFKLHYQFIDIRRSF